MSTEATAGERTSAPAISREQLSAWRQFLQAHAVITRRLEADLISEQNLPLASYDVLVQLAEAPDRRLRMTELADRVLLSRSGLTRLVDRLERDELVDREGVLGDGRGLFACLTDKGLDRLRVASETHLRGVNTTFFDRLSPEDIAALDRIMTALATQDD